MTSLPFKRALLAGFLTLFLSAEPASGYINLQDCGGFCPDCVPPCDYPFSEYCSPILIDISGAGFHLTDAQHGVQFDIAGNSKPVQIAWTAPGAMNAFLVLDRNGNGIIDNGKEMFGNFTNQPPSPDPNGFAALAEFDMPENGGNGDGLIDDRDAIFTSLRLWIDKNHDGISQSDELFTLPMMGVHSISLSYRDSRRRDQYGNLFRYRSVVNVLERRHSEVGPAAYDVFFTGYSIEATDASAISP